MKEIQGPDLCHCLAARRNARYLTRLYDRHLAPASLTVSQFSILGVINSAPGISIADLAKSMVMERTTLVRALKPLQSVGYIRSFKESGTAAIQLELSASGSAKLAEAEPFWEAAQNEREEQIGELQAVHIRNALLEHGRGD